MLHTSDWHLGRSLHRADLRDAQSRFLDSLVDTVRAERVDVVLVAGDVYDRAIPSLDAVSLCEDALVRLRDAGARVVLISGNHDSARRLGFGSRLVDSSGVYLRTRVSSLADPVLLADDAGPVAIYGVPYLEPEAVRVHLPPDPADVAADRGELGVELAEPGVEAPRGHDGVLLRAAACIRADLARRGQPRSVVLAHAWVAGGAASSSERDITVGGVGCVPMATFDGFSYTALGHLHGQQTLAEGLRYSGSPLPYSFSEAAHRKGSWLVELGPRGLGSVRQVPAPTYRPLSLLRGSLQELLTSPAYADRADHFLSVTLTDAARPDDAMSRLKARFRHVLVLSWEPVEGGPDSRSYRTRVHGRSDLDVTTEFVEHVRRTPPSDGERLLLRAALDAGRVAVSSEVHALPGAEDPFAAGDGWLVGELVDRASRTTAPSVEVA